MNEIDKSNPFNVIKSIHKGGSDGDFRDYGDPMNQSFLNGQVETEAGTIPLVTSILSSDDRRGTIKARLGVGRMDYIVSPGLYALNNPDKDSMVLVTANYKLTFDRLRKNLPNRNLWILVLDTDGINVWCAAGHGSFGTEEMINRVKKVDLSKVVNHRKLIVPQLGGPGVAAHHVKKFTGFEVVWGPIMSEDLPAFLDNDLKATTRMRTKAFPFRERITLMPVELILLLKPLLLILPAAILLGGLAGINQPGGYVNALLDNGMLAALSIASGVFAGVVLVPVLLPYLPGKAFALKGFFAGLLMAILLIGIRFSASHDMAILFETCGYILIMLSIAAFIGMNFTGSSTYTSLSGVKKEMRIAVPMQLSGLVTGLVMWIISWFIPVL